MHAHHLAGLVLHVAGGAAHDGLDAGLDLQNIEGLGHVIVRAIFQPQNLVDLLALGGQHDDGHVAVLADALAYRDAVDFGQHYIQQDKIKMSGKKFGQGFLAVGGRVRLKSLLFERIFQTFYN